MFGVGNSNCNIEPEEALNRDESNPCSHFLPSPQRPKPMKIFFKRTRRHESGMATIVVISLLSVILIFVAANLRTLYLLRSDLRLIERQQTNRLANIGPLTNAPVSNTGVKAGQ